MSLSPEMPLVAVGNAIRYLGLFRLPAKTSLMSIKASWKTPLHQFQQRHNYSSFWNVFWCESPCRRGISLESGCRNVPQAVGWGGGRQRDALTPPLGGCRDGGWMYHTVTPHRRLGHDPLSQRCGAPTCFLCIYILNFEKAHFCNGKPKQSTKKYIFGE